MGGGDIGTVSTPGVRVQVAINYGWLYLVYILPCYFRESLAAYCYMYSVLARGSCKERCFLEDQSIAVVLITFFQPHQRKSIYLRAEEHRSVAL